MMCNMYRVSRRDLSPVSTLFNLIYIAPIQNNSCLQVKALHYYRKNPNDRTMPYEQTLGGTGSKISLLTGRLRVRKGAAIWLDWLGGDEKRGKKGARERTKD